MLWFVVLKSWTATKAVSHWLWGILHRHCQEWLCILWTFPKKRLYLSFIQIFVIWITNISTFNYMYLIICTFQTSRGCLRAAGCPSPWTGTSISLMYFERILGTTTSATPASHTHKPSSRNNPSPSRSSTVSINVCVCVCDCAWDDKGRCNELALMR